MKNDLEQKIACYSISVHYIMFLFSFALRSLPTNTFFRLIIKIKTFVKTITFLNIFSIVSYLLLQKQISCLLKKSTCSN